MGDSEPEFVFHCQLVIDTSGSMSGPGLTVAKAAAEELVNTVLCAKDYVGLAGFESTVTVYQQLAMLGEPRWSSESIVFSISARRVVLPRRATRCLCSAWRRAVGIGGSSVNIHKDDVLLFDRVAVMRR